MVLKGVQFTFVREESCVEGFGDECGEIKGSHWLSSDDYGQGWGWCYANRSFQVPFTFYIFLLLKSSINSPCGLDERAYRSITVTHSRRQRGQFLFNRHRVDPSEK
jgi:hypothetical protein